MLTVQATLKCDTEGCSEEVPVKVRLFEDRIMDGACADHYPVFMEVVDPPADWTINEARYAYRGTTHCPTHKPKVKVKL